jgi:seryl-tRNA synthetase
VLDLKLIRDNPEILKDALIARGQPQAEVEALLSSISQLDGERRAKVTALQEAQTRRNAASKDIGKAKAAKRDDEAAALMAEVAGLKDAIQSGEAEEKALSAKLDEVLAGIPNVPASDVPVGGEEANKELRKWGEQPKFAFAPKQHFELGEALGLMDFETAAKLSGSRFVVLKGALARLERALGAFMLDLQTGEGGYIEINPPLLVRDDVMFGTAQLPKFEDDQFQASRSPDFFELAQKIGNLHLKKYWSPLSDRIVEWRLEGVTDIEINDRLAKIDTASEWEDCKKQALEDANERFWLIPTAEVPLTNLVREQILDETALPMRVTAHTPCFRAEAGAAGKDTRGMIRLHQFSKVELVSITTPEQSAEEHERMTRCAEEVLKRLGLAYRTIVLATGDMGFSATKTYDIEVWLPGQNAYREISSCSNCGDFQARRMAARYRPKGQAKDVRFVHTLNGSGLAVGRTLIAVMENYQQADGSIRIPEALVPYMGGMEVIEARG